jgi:hypothetical protein
MLLNTILIFYSDFCQGEMIRITQARFCVCSNLKGSLLILKYLGKITAASRVVYITTVVTGPCNPIQLFILS